MTKKDKKLTDIVYEIYREMYLQSQPPADFDKLVADATLDDQGKKVIPFMSHEIDIEVYDKILSDILDKHNVKATDRIRISINVSLGCSPKFIQKRYEKNN